MAETPTVVSVLPTTGPVAGSTVVSVTGTYFLRTYTPLCMFGTYGPVASDVQSSTLLTCLSPSSGGMTVAVDVTVSMNGLDYTTDVVQFEYEGDAAVFTVDPTRGPEGVLWLFHGDAYAYRCVAGGGTLVTVNGNKFSNSNNLLCRFGTRTVSSTYVNGMKTLCIAPPHDIGPVTVHITNNNADFTTHGVSFTYQGMSLPHPLVFSNALAASNITSVLPYMGPSSGGTVVDVLGSNFISTSYCQFGGINSTTSTFVSATHLQCESPILGVGSHPVEVTNNDGYDFTAHNIQFVSRPLETVTSLLPTTGPAWGNTHVTVTGTGFVRGLELHCQFGTLPRVSATWHSDSRVVCVSNMVAGATTVTVEVTSNNQDFSVSGIVYEYVGMTCTEDFSVVNVM